MLLYIRRSKCLYDFLTNCLLVINLWKGCGFWGFVLLVVCCWRLVFLNNVFRFMGVVVGVVLIEVRGGIDWELFLFWFFFFE